MNGPVMAGAGNGARLCRPRPAAAGGTATHVGFGHAPGGFNPLRLVFDTVALRERCASIPFEPEELLRGGEGIGVRTRRGGEVGERAGDGGRGLQMESGVGPAQRQFIVQQLKIRLNGWQAPWKVRTESWPRVRCRGKLTEL